MEKIIAFEEREILLRKGIGSLPEIRKACTELRVVNIIDTGFDIRAHLSVDNFSFTRVLCTRENYIPLKDWSELDINNKIIELI